MQISKYSYVYPRLRTLECRQRDRQPADSRHDDQRSAQEHSRHRRERRSIPPFGSGAAPNTISNILDRVLARCRCDPFTDMSFSKEDIFFLSPDDIDRSIQPQFKIVVDFTNDITNRLSIHRDDLELGLSVRSSYLRRYAVLGRWSIHSIPSDPWSPDPAKLKGLQSGRGMDFVLALRVATTRKELVRQGLEPGKVLTRKVFSVKETADTFTFPFQWVRFGGDTGYPDQALWVIQWTDGEDDAHFERPVDQVLTVMVNEKAEGPLSAMDEVHGANDLAWRMLAADITTQILDRCLVQDGLRA